jgi:4-deoxy-L-threo-5-hexosulose-uronate ketol-isomerase
VVVFGHKEGARFYVVSAPAHQGYPTTVISKDDALAMNLGKGETMNERTINRYIHPEGVRTCQLVMGITDLAPGSGWNTIPSHVHDRRSEVYCYFDMDPDHRVLHLMGEPTETRHLILASEQAVLSPPWSIHSGAGTAAYSFIWAMAGDNVDYTDMDPVPLDQLR